MKVYDMINKIQINNFDDNDEKVEAASVSDSVLGLPYTIAIFESDA